MKRKLQVCLLMIVLIWNMAYVSLAAEDKLMIDNQNIYEGMEKAYQDGYEPKIQEDKASVILPLYAENMSEIEAIRVTPVFERKRKSPFEIVNYQKTFQPTVEKINGGKEDKSVFLVAFDFSLKKERINGTYPVNLDVTYKCKEEKITQTFPVYVSIRDGKEPDSKEEENQNPDYSTGAEQSEGGNDEAGGAVSVPEETKEEKPTSEPKVLISGCKEIPEKIMTGEEFGFRVILKNMSKSKHVQNLSITVSCEKEDLNLLADSNVYYFDYLGAGKTLEIPLKFRCNEKAESGKYTVSFEMSYDNPKATALTSSGKIGVNIMQKTEMALEIGEFSNEMNAGDSVYIPAQAMNLGRGKVYNVRCMIDVPGLEADKSLFLGNMEGGSALSGELKVFAHAVNENATSENERYGKTEGYLTLLYEDENGVEHMTQEKITASIKPLHVEKERKKEEQKTNIGLQMVIGICVLTIVVIGMTVGAFLWRKKREERFYEDGQF